MKLRNGSSLVEYVNETNEYGKLRGTLLLKSK